MKKMNRSMYEERRGVPFLTILICLVLMAAIVALARTYKRWEGQAPEVALDHDFKTLGRAPSLALTVQDAGTGLKQVTIRLKTKDQELVLADDSFERSVAEKSKTYDVGKLLQTKYQIQAGAASLDVTASDHAIRNFGHGNQTQFTKNFEFDISPPRLEVLSGQHYINQGGSECVVYRVSPDAEISGVQAGPHFFPGYPANLADPNVKFCLFAFAYNIPPDSPLKMVARDAAGNEAVTGFWYKLFPKKFRSRDIKVEDSFLQKVVPEIMSHTPEIKDQGDLVKTFVELNSKLRRLNH